MNSRRQTWVLRSEIFLSWLVLLTLVFYTYLEIAKAPYIGFNYNASTGNVQLLYERESNADLRVHDQLVMVGDVDFAEWRENLASELFPPLRGGEILRLEIRRDGQPLVIDWQVPGFNQEEFSNRVYNSWWMGYLFWMTGLATLLLVRPLDPKRSLFAAFFFLTALWLVIGNTSRWGHGDSRILYRMVLCLSVPVLLHLHWLFPRPLGKIPTPLLWTLYGLTVAAALLHWTPIASPEWAVLAFGLALLGSLVLLLLHYIRQPETRPQVRLLIFSLLFAVLPLTALSLTVAAQVQPRVGPYALAALPIIPGAYFFSIYRYQLGGSEFRANRLIAVYLFMILLGTISLIVVATLSVQPGMSDSVALWSALLALATALITLYGFVPFQRLVDRRLLAIPLPPVELLDTYLTRITTTLNQDSLVHLLKEEVLPSLLVRQSALLRFHNNVATTIYSTEPELATSEVEQLVTHLKHEPIYRAGAYQGLPPLSWVKVGLALQVEDKLLGMWLLGRHDPDDIYSAAEVATLQTIARQTALALANIEQSNQLHAIYEASIERQEQERMKMAHFLHDAILNQAAVLYMSLDMATLTPRVDTAYETLKGQIHQMISSLRPPSLDLGLGAALEELGGELLLRPNSKFELRLKGSSDVTGYPPLIENHIFRIVQQACENAFRHAHANLIQVTGTLAPDHVELLIEDDGVGFEVSKPLDITSLLAHKHFGLVHMMERAEHINAELNLASEPGKGTRVHLVWSNNNAASN